MQIRNLKNDLYQLLNSSNDISKERDSIISAINIVKKQIEIIYFEHFKDIQNLCTEEQKSKFEELTKKLDQIFDPPPPRMKD